MKLFYDTICMLIISCHFRTIKSDRANIKNKTIQQMINFIINNNFIRLNMKDITNRKPKIYNFTFSSICFFFIFLNKLLLEMI